MCEDGTKGLAYVWGHALQVLQPNTIQTMRGGLFLTVNEVTQGISIKWVPVKTPWRKVSLSELNDGVPSVRWYVSMP